MKTFIKKAALFTLILAFINLMLFFGYSNLYLEEYVSEPEGYKDFLFSDSHGLALGDRTSEFGVYNFSAGSEAYTDIKRKLGYLIRNQKVDRVLLQMEGQVMSAFRQGSNNADRSVYYASSSDFEWYAEYIREAFIRYYVVLLNPKSQSLFRYYLRSRISSLFRTPGESSGTEWYEQPQQQREDYARERAEQFYVQGLSDELIQSLQDIVELCRRHNIQLIGVQFPVTDELLNALNDPRMKEISESYLRSEMLFNSYHIDIINMDEFFRGKDRLFRDEDHLNEKGADIFADKMRQILN